MIEILDTARDLVLMLRFWNWLALVAPCWLGQQPPNSRLLQVEGGFFFLQHIFCCFFSVLVKVLSKKNQSYYAKDPTREFGWFLD